MEISELEAGRVYADHNSEIDRGDRTDSKLKYKLNCRFHSNIADYFFLILGTDGSSYSIATRVELNQSDYEYISSGYMTKWPGYVCPSKKDFIPPDELDAKIKDNIFFHAGTLKNEVMENIIEKCKSFVVRAGTPSSDDKLMASSMWGDDTGEGILDRWIKGGRRVQRLSDL